MQAQTAQATSPVLDTSWLALVTHWRLIIAELLTRGIDIHHPDVLAGPWLSVRAAIFDLIDSPTRLREVLKRR